MVPEPPSGNRMTNTGPLDFARTFAFTVKTLKFIGIPSCLDRYPETWSAAVKANRGLIVSFLSLAYCVLGQLIYFWTNIRWLAGEEMFLEFANQIACTGFCTVGLLKLFMLAYHRNLLARLLTELGVWWNDKNQIPADRIQNERQIRPNMTIVTVTIIANICMVSAFNLLPIAEMIVQFCQTGPWNLKLPYQIWFPWNPLSKWVYPVMYTFHVYSGFIVAIGNVVSYIENGFDCIFCLIAAHLTVQFNKLNRSFEQLVVDNKLSIMNQLTLQRQNNNPFQEVPNKVRAISKRPNVGVIKSDIIALIEHHKKLLDFKVPMEKIFSITFFVTFSGASVIICLQGIMITTASGYVVAKYFMFFICILLEIYFLCYYGHVMSQSNIKIGTSAFHSYCYKTSFNNSSIDNDIGKRLVLIIMRSQKPFQIMAWKFWPLTVTSFSKIINASWSYFSLINALLKK